MMMIGNKSINTSPKKDELVENKFTLNLANNMAVSFFMPLI